MESYIRHARPADLEEILRITESGRQYLQDQGLSQWQDGFGPNRDSVETAIQTGQGYVLLFQDHLAGYGSLIPGPDGSPPLTEGQWAGAYDTYAAIHQVAISPAHRGRGLAARFMGDMVTAASALGYQDIRIDTHRGNLIMQKTILRAGFTYRGVMHLPIPDGERLAYQIILD